MFNPRAFTTEAVLERSGAASRGGGAGGVLTSQGDEQADDKVDRAVGQQSQ